MFASSLSSAARQPKGRGYSRKQRDIENRLGYRGRPASPKKFRRISQRTQRFLPPSLSPSLASKARECLQSPVVSIRRRLPPTGHVRFTSRAGKCIGMLAFFFFPSSSSSFSSSSPRSIPLEEIVGRGETRRANRIPDAGNEGNVGYVGRETKLIDAVKREEREREEERISFSCPYPKWQWEKFPADTWNLAECRSNTDMDAYRWANESRELITSARMVVRTQ